MDFILIPDIHRIMHTSYQTIDTFATLCENLEVHFNSTKTEWPTSKIQNIMKRLTEYKPNTVIPEVNMLFHLLTETVLYIVASQKTSGKTPKTSVGQFFGNAWKKFTSSADDILPIHTFDESTIQQHYNEAKQLKKLIDEHHKIYKQLQKQQKECWIAKSKLTKYELCLLTAKKSRAFMNNKLPENKLKTRDNAIDELQNILNIKVKRGAEASSIYWSLLDKESFARSCIKKLERKIVNDILFGLTDRVNSGLSALKNILINIPGKLLSLINDVEFDIGCFGAAIIDNLSSKYSWYYPQVFHEQNGFKVRLPNCLITSYKDNLTQQANNNNESQCELDYNFQKNQRLKIESLVGNTSKGFVKLTKGMTVKQKISTESSDVVFGWFKEKLWHQKSWAFFQKDTSIIQPV